MCNLIAQAVGVYFSPHTMQRVTEGAPRAAQYLGPLVWLKCVKFSKTPKYFPFWSTVTRSSITPRDFWHLPAPWQDLNMLDKGIFSPQRVSGDV